jgi:hypothetical protein
MQESGAHLYKTAQRTLALLDRLESMSRRLQKSKRRPKKVKKQIVVRAAA